MTLAQYRRKFPNIDWREPSPAAEFAMDDADVAPLFAEMNAADAARFRCLLSLGRKWGKTLEICVRFPLNKDPRDCLDEIVEAQKNLPPRNNRKTIRLK